MIGIPGNNANYPGGIAFSTKAADGTTTGVPVERMRITYAGNLGVGTTSPSAKLDVSGSVAVYGGLSNTSTRPAISAGTMTNGEIRGYSASGISADDGFLRLSAGGGTTAGTKSYIDLSGYSNGVSDMYEDMIFGTAGTERMRIVSTGYVGIGTNSAAAVTAGVAGPYATMDAVGNIFTSLHTSTNEHASTEQGTSYIGHQAGSNVGNDGFNGMKLIVQAGTNGCGNTGDVAFNTWECNTASSREIMHITGRGNVGIGISTPGNALEVVDAGNSNQYYGTLSVFANNLTQGVGIGYAGIQALGSNTNQNLYINARGTGSLYLLNQNAGNVLIGDPTNNANPYLLPSASGVTVRIGNSSTPFQDIFNNYSYVKNWVAIGKNFGTSASAALDAEGNTNNSGTLTGANGYIAYFTNGGTNQSGAILTNVSSNANGCRYMECEVNGSEVGCLYGNGGNALNIYSASDQRLKKNIRNTNLGLHEIMQIPVRDYTWRDGEKNVSAGFIAQELYKVYPDAVLRGDDEAGLDTKKGGTWMVNYAGLTPLIVKSIQDQQHIIEDQKAEIEQLKKQISELKSASATLEEINKLKASVETLQQILQSKAEK